MGSKVQKKLPWNKAVLLFKSLIKNLKGNKDAIAIQLYREGVRKAQCSDPMTCALAQYLVNNVGPGYTVEVGGGSCALREHESGEIMFIHTRQGIDQFIDAFDNREYPFLQSA